jgi:hypothetical protein
MDHAALGMALIVVHNWLHAAVDYDVDHRVSGVRTDILCFLLSVARQSSARFDVSTSGAICMRTIL